MTPRIACVVFVTLIWGASTQNEEKIRDVFKSNLTRNDFSGLLQSLIKLNERRVSVLQKLYRLEDYGVLSEVLRSGDERNENEDPSNMFLIVMSKNKTIPSIYIGSDGIELLPSLDGSSNKNKTHEKRSNARKNLELVNNPAGFIENIRKVINRDIPKFYEAKQINLPGEESKEIIIIKEPLKHRKIEEKNSHFNLSKALKASRRANFGRHGRENRFEIVNNNDRSNENHKQQDYKAKRNNQLPIFMNNDRTKQFPEAKMTLPITSGDIYKYLFKDKDKVDDNLSSLSEEIKVKQDSNNKFFDINSNESIKNDHDNDSKTNEDNLKENVNTELNPHKIANNQDNRYNKMKAELVRKLEDKINGNKNSDKASGQNQTLNMKRWINRYPKLMKQETKANNTEPEHLPRKIIHKNTVIVKQRNDKKIISLGESLDGNTDPNRTKDLVNETLDTTELPKDLRVDSKMNDLIINKPYEELQPNEPPVKDGGEENSETTKINANKFPVFNNAPTKVKRKQPKEDVLPKDPKSDENEPETSKPALRKTYKKHIKRKGEKVCSKSCISAYKIVCKRFRCSSRSKKALKKECKRSCRRTFQASGSSSSGDDSDDRSRGHRFWFGKNRYF